MGVLAIAHGLSELAGEGTAARGFLTQLLGEPGGDRRIIGRRPSIGPRRQLLAQRKAGAAVRLQFGQHFFEVGNLGTDRHIAVVLGRRADHGRTADVDVLDAVLERTALRDRGLERIKVHIDDIDGADAVVGHGLGVFGRVAHAQQAAVDDGMQRLHAPVHHFREVGQVGDILHRQACPSDRRAGAARGDQLNTMLGEQLGGLDQAGLVGDRDQRALGRDQVGCGREIGGGGHGSLLWGYTEIAQASGMQIFRAPRWSPTFIRQSRGMTSD